MRRWARVDADGFRERVRGLVDQHFGGSENRAAAAWKIRQSTLNRFLTGKTSRPSVDFGQKIARYHKVALGWLVEGEGTAPALPEAPREEGEAWRALVRSLGLTSRTERALLVLPMTTGRAFRDLSLRGVTGHPEGVFHIAPAMARGAWQAARYEYLAWTHLLQGMLDAYGRKAVTAKLEAEWLQFALGYQGLALNLCALQSITPEAVEKEFTEYAMHPAGGVIQRWRDVSTVPGLESERVKSGASRGEGA